MAASNTIFAAVFVSACFMSCHSVAQSSIDFHDELLRMGAADQQGRQRIIQIEQQYGATSSELQQALDAQLVADAANMQRLEQIIEQSGWPKSSEVGEDGAEAAFLILQHADLATQQKYLPLFRDAVVSRQAKPSHYALLYDRVLMGEGKKQLYGTQLRRNEENGTWFLWPVENEAEVDERRARLGMDPLQQYLEGFPVELDPVPQSVQDSFAD